MSDGRQIFYLVVYILYVNIKSQKYFQTSGYKIYLQPKLAMTTEMYISNAIKNYQPLPSENKLLPCDFDANLPLHIVPHVASSKRFRHAQL